MVRQGVHRRDVQTVKRPLFYWDLAVAREWKINTENSIYGGKSYTKFIKHDLPGNNKKFFYHNTEKMGINI